jgi:hypothetical protein
VRVSSAAFNSDVFVKRFKFQISMWELECIKLCACERENELEVFCSLDFGPFEDR